MKMAKESRCIELGMGMDGQGLQGFELWKHGLDENVCVSIIEGDGANLLTPLVQLLLELRGMLGELECG